MTVLCPQSDRYEVSATAKDQSTLDSLIIEKVGDTLNIYRKDEGLLNSLATMFGSSTPKVYITLPKLTAAKSSAGADLNIEAFSAKDLNLSVSSGADLNALQLSVNSISADSSSGADLRLGGTCIKGDYSVSSGADIEAHALVCNSIMVDASSGGDASVHASLQLKAHASSGADIEIHGTPSQTETTTSSGGHIEAK